MTQRRWDVDPQRLSFTTLSRISLHGGPGTRIFRIGSPHIFRVEWAVREPRQTVSAWECAKNQRSAGSAWLPGHTGRSTEALVVTLGRSVIPYQQKTSEFQIAPLVIAPRSEAQVHKMRPIYRLRCPLSQSLRISQEKSSPAVRTGFVDICPCKATVRQIVLCGWKRCQEHPRDNARG